MSAGWVEDNCHGLVDRVRESWGWLRLLVEPGRQSRSAPVLTDAQRARLARAVRDERADRVRLTITYPDGRDATSAGPGALAPAAAPARLGVLDAQAVVRALVTEAAHAAARALGAVYIGSRADGWAVDEALSWLDGGRPVWVATRSSILGRQLRDSILDQLHLTALRDVARLLTRADEVARTAAGVGVDGDESGPFPHACPACGRRSLQWQMPAGDESRWSVQCIREACRCVGAGCGCLQAVRYPQRRHAWAVGELDGPWGLWRAVAAASRRPPRIRSHAEGHGGWPGKRRRK